MNSDSNKRDHLLDESIKLLSELYFENLEFNEHLDSGDLVQVGDFNYPLSKALFWLDREAYFDAKTNWTNESLYEKHSEALHLLNASERITVFKGLANSLCRSKLIPFIGAGICKPMGMPLWHEALSELHNRICTPHDPKITALIQNGELVHAAMLLSDKNPTISENYIRTKYRVQKLSGPIEHLPKLSNGCIITTNFDDAIEETFKNINVGFDGYMYGKEEHNFFARLVRGDRCLLKLHGDSDNPKTYILNKNQYTDAYGEPFNFKLPLPKALRQIYISNTLLFLGCSLEQDWTLSIFRNVLEIQEYEVPMHYAILESPVDEKTKQAKETSLLELNIQPIWYPNNQHEFVDLLLQLLIDVSSERISLEVQL